MSFLSTGFLALVATYVCAAPVPPKWPGSDRPSNLSSHGISADFSQVVGRTFDYVICGGGLTGLTVASRLSEDPNIHVLVIEAGGDDHSDPRVYDVRTYGQAFETHLDWNITSTPVTWQNSTRLDLVAGRTLGGSGYDLLPLVNGDDSWAWEPFNAYMLKAEHFNVPLMTLQNRGAMYNADYHGEAGPVEVSFASGIFAEPQQQAIEASQKVWQGLTRDVDATDGNVTGATIIANMVVPDASQNRSSPFTAYVQRQIQQRDNLLILTGHRVTRIGWKDGDNVVAERVYFQAEADSEVHSVKTRGEVLLAAGSLQSPQILELSGVGDPKVLAAAGVPLKKAAPGVGKHMQEQTKNSLYLTAQEREFNGSGPPSAIAFPDVHMLLGKNASAVYEDVKAGLPSYAVDLERQGLVVDAEATHMILAAQVDNLFKDNAPAAEIFFTITPHTNQLDIDLWNLIVLSRGTCHIHSNNSWDHPIVEPSYFNHPLDLTIQVAASKQGREVYRTDPLAQFVRKKEKPGNADGPDGDDGDWEGWVKSSFTSVWHYIATLAMMKEEFGGVVGTDFKVYGTENVRAIDASVLPIQLSAHLSSSLYGIAEKAAVEIKKDQRKA
ncbi:hypothetical protein LTR56_022103 [Elasticomyces elasticus]|nr:hypothetical protein LTR56_022103 [Elasticomyces elasticus]KAK3641992.1 hypothetical protein LTR22_016317 [Elasticomyces elasticus]KAK4910657.1 hypothetical protein LTR49_020692 [Elasticomyces elasticus]KAK5748837.1 hypothetical protein LTS12_021075 [Elasticomyces elasticus]